MDHFRKLVILFTAGVIAVLVYIYLPADCPEPARRAAAVFIIGALLWATEVIPLYATSLLVVLLEILFLCRPGGVLQMDKSGYAVFLVPFSSPVIMLFFGGFVIAGVIRKYKIADVLAYQMLHVFGRRPSGVLFGFMCATAFLSMWMSNTATTAMMLAMILPLLSRFDLDDPFKTALVLAVAFAANIGGMGTPVGTPPNAIAIGLLVNQGIHIRFLSWMMMAVPLVLVLILLTGQLLLFLFRPKYTELRFSLPVPAALERRAWIVSATVVFTVILWLTSQWHGLPEALTALLAVGFLAVTGFVTKKDFHDIDWDILILMWGGLALGTGMEISGLTDWLVQLPVFHGSGVFLVAVFMTAAALLSTFISNTAAANLIMPLAMSLPGDKALPLTVIAALACSIAMALPVSTPPNAIVFSTGEVKSREMFKSGIIVTLFAMALLIAGYRIIFYLAFKSV